MDPLGFRAWPDPRLSVGLGPICRARFVYRKCRLGIPIQEEEHVQFLHDDSASDVVWTNC